MIQSKFETAHSKFVFCIFTFQNKSENLYFECDLVSII